MFVAQYNRDCVTLDLSTKLKQFVEVMYGSTGLPTSQDFLKFCLKKGRDLWIF
jgi:hypothetical protein